MSLRYFKNLLFHLSKLKEFLIVLLINPFYSIKINSYVPDKRNIIFPVKIGYKTKLNNVTKIEKYVSINDNCIIMDNVKHIGRFSSISDKCYLGIENHPKYLISTHSMFYTNNWGYNFFDKDIFIRTKKKETVIEEDVWMGYGVMVMAGCTIGRGSIIAAGSFVNKSVPRYTIWGGVPAKEISKRFNNHQIKFLEDSKWWLKTPQEIKDLILEFKKII